MEPFETGAVIAGKFRLERPLAKGGMGSVWVARHLQLDLNVALKFMSADVAKSASGRARFEREAKAAAHLQSPHIVSVLDYGVDGEIPYMAMELLKGEDLETRLRRDKRLPLPELLTLLTQAAKGLRRAHEAGIVHRDLKPRNMFLVHGPDDEDLLLKILDFGIAKEMNKALVDDVTKTGQVIGSPNYMSPEQIRAVKDIDYRTDLWSLGVIVFHAATGRLPFSGEAIGDIFAKILIDPLPVATSLCPDLPPSIDAFFERALARKPLNRFSSAREMTVAFAEVVSPAAPQRDSRWSQPGDAPRHRSSGDAIVLPDEPNSERTTQVKQGGPAHTPPTPPAPNKPTTTIDAEESEAATTAGTLSRPAMLDVTTVDFRGPSRRRAAVLGLALVAIGGALLVLRSPSLMAMLNDVLARAPAQSTGLVTTEQDTPGPTPPPQQIMPSTTSQVSPTEGSTTPEPSEDKQSPKELKTKPGASLQPHAPHRAAKVPPRTPNASQAPADPPDPPPAAIAAKAAPIAPPTTTAPAQASPSAPKETPNPPPAPTNDPMKLGF